MESIFPAFSCPNFDFFFKPLLILEIINPAKGRKTIINKVSLHLLKIE